MQDIEDLGSVGCESCPTAQTVGTIYDVVIIGAGVIGCSVARELSKYKLQVLVLEKANDVAAGASKANSGIVHGGYDARHGTLKGELSHKGNRMFAQLDKELNFGYKELGSLVIGFSPEDIAKLEELKRNGISNGVDGLQILNKEQTIEKEPHVNPSVFCSLYCPEAGVVSPYEYTIALAENAVANGVDLRLKEEVTQIQTHHSTGEFVVHTEDSTFHTRTIINCAGIHSDSIAAMVGPPGFAIHPVKGEYLILHKSQGHLARHVIFPLPSPTLGKGILVSPTYWGNLLLGPTARHEDHGHESKELSNLDVIKYILHQARRSVPSFDASKTITSYAGLRAKSDRGDFIVEESTHRPGFFNVAGIDSPGLTSSPAVAKKVVEDLLAKRIQLVQNTHFNPNRRPILQQPKSEEWLSQARVDHPSPELNIICRCEQVSESEIVDSIHRKPTCLSLDGVKKRTRAGMGQCQARFCQSRVSAILARELHVLPNMVPQFGKGSSILPHRRLTPGDRDMLSKL
eukprot:TRINITY_DN66693_c12_g2_i1.p1 TRINITY_DN66693_c12_g2~~TRINITY_DN66693_c12_g2_i1.p1  ORF type:complete len:516 (-),score=10.57 TRINITY_DN66693_c12_g2_i1:1209-2756(-)